VSGRSRSLGPLADRLQSSLRDALVSMDRLAALVPAGGLVLDLGCGQGLLTRRLATRAERVIGVDFDPRKCEMARAALAGVANVEIVCGTIDDLLARTPRGSASAAVLSDVLSAIPAAAQDALFPKVVEALQPGGVLLIKFMDTEPRWKARLSLVLSSVVCGVLRASLTEGARFTYRSAATYRRLLENLGCTVEEHRFDRLRPLPHAALVARTPVR
jgi:2-polyprenyl-3-methyl-5-hydroxy-6-metoxy-1,4-benzoquinol methylase